MSSRRLYWLFLSASIYSVVFLTGLILYRNLQDQYQATSQELEQYKNSNVELAGQIGELEGKLEQLKGYLKNNEKVVSSLNKKVVSLGKQTGMNSTVKLEFGTCILPKLNPFDKTIAHLQTNVTVPPCTKITQNLPKLAVLEKGVLRVASESVNSMCAELLYQHYKFGADDKSVIGGIFNPLSSPVSVTGDFVEVVCKISEQSEWYNKLEKKVAKTKKTMPLNEIRQFLSNVHENKEAYERAQKALNRNRPIHKPFNILFIGMDSVSHANFYRQLPNTVSYLLKNFEFANQDQSELNYMRTHFFESQKLSDPYFSELDYEIDKRPVSKIYELGGYSIVGDGTTAQLMGILTGNEETGVYEARARVSGSKHVDDWPWVFKNATELGYVTLFAEDEPGIGAFQLRLKGFKKQPTDHYLRPFWLGHSKYYWALYPDPMFCKGNDPTLFAFDYQLKYNQDFFEKYPDVPKFAFTFSKTSHEDFNLLKGLDIELRDYIEVLHQTHVLQDTFVFLFGDHGSRFGPLRETIQGKLEERMPLQLILVPQRFSELYPELAEQLFQSQARLTTPFDIYSTILHIMKLPYMESANIDFSTAMETGIVTRDFHRSLLLPVPLDRTCESAHVADHWCVCQQWELMDKSDKVVVDGTKSLVGVINDLIIKEGEDRCDYPLSLDKVNYAQKLKTSDKVEAFAASKDRDGRVAEFDLSKLKVESYLVQVQFTMTPGNGIFEGTFHVDVDRNTTIAKYTPEHTFSRVNAYGTLTCDPKPLLRQFCVCKN